MKPRQKLLRRHRLIPAQANLNRRRQRSHKCRSRNRAARGWLTTFLNDLPIQPTGDSAFFRARPIEIPLETDDDGTGRSEVAQFYERSPQHYWVHFGIPPLARLSDINEAAGRNPQDSFAGLNRGFDARRFHTAFQGGLLAAEFTERLTFFLESGQGTNEAVNSSFRFFVTELDSVYEAPRFSLPARMRRRFSRCV